MLVIGGSWDGTTIPEVDASVAFLQLPARPTPTKKDTQAAALNVPWPQERYDVQRWAGNHPRGGSGLHHFLVLAGMDEHEVRVRIDAAMAGPNLDPNKVQICRVAPMDYPNGQPCNCPQGSCRLGKCGLPLYASWPERTRRINDA